MRMFLIAALAMIAICAGAVARGDQPSSAVMHMSPAVASFIAYEKEALENDLLDPGTVQYRYLMVYSHPSAKGPGYCLMGEVNAKNAYGGYVGFREFVNETISPPPTLDSENGAAAAAFTRAANACMKGGKLVFIEAPPSPAVAAGVR